MKKQNLLSTTVIGTTILIALSACSSNPKTSDIRDGRLDSCPGAPNCVQSEFPEEKDHYFAPIDVSNYFSEVQTTESSESETYTVEKPAVVSTKNSASKSDLESLRTDVLNTIEAIDGRIIKQDQTYIHATFTSKIMRYVDDFEIRIDEKEKKLHLRSTSRVGYSDMGVNRKRAEKFKTEFLKAKSE